MKQLQPFSHQIQPDRHLQVIVIILECLASVKRRVDVYALDLPGEVLLQRLERNQIVAVNQHVLAARIAVGFLRVFEEDAWFDRLLLIVFADPCQLEFSFFLLVWYKKS